MNFVMVPKIYRTLEINHQNIGGFFLLEGSSHLALFPSIFLRNMLKYTRYAL